MDSKYLYAVHGSGKGSFIRICSIDLGLETIQRDCISFQQEQSKIDGYQAQGSLNSIIHYGVIFGSWDLLLPCSL